MMENKEETLYKKNIDAIMQGNPFLWELVKEKKEYDKEVYMDRSMQGEEIVAFLKEGRSWYLNSRYDAAQAAEVWAEDIGDVTYVATLFVFGIGNGIYLRQLKKKYPENTIVVYEPSRAVFEMLLNETDMTDILSDDKIFLSVGEEGYGLFVEYVISFVNYANYTYVKWLHLPNYQRLFEKEYLNVKRHYVNWVQHLVINRNTYLISQEEYAKNILENLWDSLNAYSMDELALKLKENVDVEKYPAIIVSAGPSLDKNIHELKKAEKKAFLIVVDTALKTVLRAGIRPDITITVDPHKPIVLFEDARISELPMVVCLTSNTQVLQKHKGKKIYFGEGKSYYDSIYKMYGKKVSSTETGGSVANNAFSLAQFLGFKTIVLIGQDLAYPDKKGHTKEAYDEKEAEIDFTKEKYIEVEDIYGGKVWTEGNMDAYRRWFEKQITRYKDWKVIDATEGGAKIHGAEILTLKETIQRECEDLPEVDFSEIIEKIEPSFNEEELEEIKMKLRTIPNELELICEKLEEGIEKYRDLKKTAKERKLRAKKIKRLMNEIGEMTEWLENKPEMQLVQMYNYKADYNMQGKVFDIQDDVKDELSMIADNGIEMYESYFTSIDRLKENLDILYQTIEE